MRFQSKFGMTAMVLILSGCINKFDYESPEIALPESFLGEGTQAASNIAGTTWWTQFGDDRLNTIVSDGLDANLTVRLAVERMLEARAAARGVGVGFTGDFDLEGGYSDATNSDESGVFSADLGVSWLLDFFGSLSNAREGAAAELQAAGFDVEAARLAYLSQVLNAYIDARFFQESIALQRQNLASRRESLNLTQRLLQAEAGTRLDLNQAQGLVDDTLADIPELEVGYQSAVNRLATLLGRPAGTLQQFMSGNADVPLPPNSYPSSVPADLLRNRPDIQSAERSLAAAAAEIGVARADLYPSVRLGGLVRAFTTTGATFGGDESVTAVSWQFGPSLNIPVFGRRVLTSQLSVREAQARQARLTWESTVLTAVEEVQTALTSVDRSRASVAARRSALRTFEEGVSLARASYAEGNISLFDVLDAERSVAGARIDLAQAQQRYARAFVSLNVALGAGRNVRGPEPEVVAAATTDEGQ